MREMTTKGLNRWAVEDCLGYSGTSGEQALTRGEDEGEAGGQLRSAYQPLRCLIASELLPRTTKSDHVSWRKKREVQDAKRCLLTGKIDFPDFAQIRSS